MTTPTVAGDQLGSYLAQSAARLIAHAKDCDAAAPRLRLETAFRIKGHDRPSASLGDVPPQTAGTAQVTLFWNNFDRNGMKEVVWDRFNVDMTVSGYREATSAAQLARAGFETRAESGSWYTDAALPALPPLWKHHPCRFHALAPLAAQVQQLGMDCDGAPTLQMLTALTKVHKAWDNEVLRTQPLRARVESRRNHGRSDLHYVELLSAIAQHWHAGMPIYDIPADLQQQLRSLPLQNVPLSTVRSLPQHTVYLSFGVQPDAPLAPDWLVEGAYVSTTQTSEGRILTITLVAAPQDLSVYLDFGLSAEPSYLQSYGPRLQDLGLGDAVACVHAEKLAQLHAETKFIPTDAELEAKARAAGLPKGARLAWVTHLRAAEELAQLPQRHAAFERTFKLIIQALRLIDRSPSAWKAGWPGGAPAELVHALSGGGTPAAKQRARRKLQEQGFFQVLTYAGGPVVREAPTAQPSAGTPSVPELERPAPTWELPPAPTGHALTRALNRGTDQVMRVTHAFKDLESLLARASDAQRKDYFGRMMAALDVAPVPDANNLERRDPRVYVLVSWVLSLHDEVLRYEERLAAVARAGVAALGQRFPFQWRHETEVWPVYSAPMHVCRVSEIAAEAISALMPAGALVPHEKLQRPAIEAQRVQVLTHLMGPFEPGTTVEQAMNSPAALERDAAVRRVYGGTLVEVVEGPLPFSRAWATAEERALDHELGRVMEDMRERGALQPALPLSLVTGSLRLAHPLPDRALPLLYVHADTGALLGMVMPKLSYRMDAADLALRAAAKLLNASAGVPKRIVACAEYDQAVLPETSELTLEGVMEAIMLPGLDGSYRSAVQTWRWGQS